eukprot:TRINITY_DN24028_c0_g1_i1.p1 TRINITY_DN24028_c0_g1~~TRINITY_DN24028_c0_g1_i1.p1  ORF type:complete len:454 (+),score=44.10 TRINITY_DN24028_c0_g1_i1:61-1422(+)
MGWARPIRVNTRTLAQRLQRRHLPSRFRAGVIHVGRTSWRRWLCRDDVHYCLVLLTWCVTLTSVSEATQHRVAPVGDVALAEQTHAEVMGANESVHDSVTPTLRRVVFQNKLGDSLSGGDAFPQVRNQGEQKYGNCGVVVEKVLHLIRQNSSATPSVLQMAIQTLIGDEQGVNLVHDCEGIDQSTLPIIASEVLTLLVGLAMTLCVYALTIWLFGRFETTASLCSKLPFRVVFAVFLLTSVYIFAILYASTVLGELISYGLREGARDQYGLQFRIGSFKIDPFTGRFRMRNMMLLNPDGYSSMFVLGLKRGSIEVGMHAFVLSGGRHLKFDNLVVEGLEIISETTASGANNIQNTLAGLRGGGGASNLTDRSGGGAGGRSIVIDTSSLHRAAFVDMRVKVSIDLFGSAMGPWINIPNIKFNDFVEKVGELHLNDLSEFVFRLLMQMVLQTIGS